MNDFITNGTEIKQRIISEINDAMHCIYLAMAYFTDKDIANALIKAKERGVLVDIILSSNLQNDSIKILLRDSGINVHSFDTGDKRGIMHHKFCLLDNKIVINGSFNYSYNASTNNVENITVMDNLSTYSKFHDEFDRLRFKIDNNLDLNSENEITVNNKSVISMSPVEAFLNQINFLVFSSADLDVEVYKNNGFEKSRDNRGHIDIFRTEYKDIKEQIRSFATNNSLGSKKNVLNTNISNAFENAKSNLVVEKDKEKDIVNRDFDLLINQINERNLKLDQENDFLIFGNSQTGEKGITQINLEIEKIKLERESLEQLVIVKKFWSVSTILSMVLLVIFCLYLSLFFGSAIFKVFFEENIIKNLSEQGIRPPFPVLVDANAIFKIYELQGLPFGVMATLFFIIPILFSNLELLGSKSKFFNWSCLLIGVVIFDIVVSIMVSKNQQTVLAYLDGTIGTFNFQISEVYKTGEFWLIFVFGTLPLIITHFIISKISLSYVNSQPDLVDSEKANKIFYFTNKLIELQSTKDILNSRIEEVNLKKENNDKEIQNLQIRLNSKVDEIVTKYSDLTKQIKDIYDQYSSKIISGQIFTDEILNSVLSAFKSGFIKFLPEYFAPSEVANRVNEIERTIQII